ncbi:MAG: hypothetical protein OXU36_10585 [Candidatus Poribacteria bacterium]|nr:hypothetical protein [Candidatus Poribacteria bacterium]
MPTAEVRVHGDASSLDKALSTSQSKMKAFGASMTSAGKTATTHLTAPILGAAAGLGALALKAIGAGDKIQLLSDKSGLSTTKIQELTHAGGIAGTEIEAMANASGKFAKVIGDSERGLSTAKDALGKLGIQLRDNNGVMKSQDELFEEAIMKLQAMKGGTEKMALAQEVFGRGGREMLPILNMSAKQFAALKNEAHDLGTVLSADAVKALDTMDDELTRITGSIKGVGLGIAQDAIPLMEDLIATIRAEVVPWLQAAGEKIGDAIQWFQGLSPEVKTMIGVMTGLAVAAGPVAVVIGTIATVISGPLIAAVAAGAAAIAGITAIVVYWDEVTAALTATWEVVKGLFTDNPWLSALFPLLGGIVALVENWDSVTRGLSQAWDWVVGIIMGAIESISGAVSEFLGFFGVETDSALGGFTSKWTDAYDAALAKTKKTTEAAAESTETAMEDSAGSAQGFQDKYNEIMTGVEAQTGTTMTAVSAAAKTTLEEDIPTFLTSARDKTDKEFAAMGLTIESTYGEATEQAKTWLEEGKITTDEYQTYIENAHALITESGKNAYKSLGEGWGELVETTIKPKTLEMQDVVLPAFLKQGETDRLVKEAMALEAGKLKDKTSEIMGQMGLDFDSVAGPTGKMFSSFKGLFGIDAGGGLASMAMGIFGSGGILTAALGPAGPVLAALPGLVSNFKKAFDGIKSMASKVFSGIKNAASSVWNTIRGGGDSDSLKAQRPLMQQMADIESQRAALSASYIAGDLSYEDYLAQDKVLTDEHARLARESDSYAAATGFEGMVYKPTSFLVGERGPEYVSVTPSHRSAGGGGQTLIANFFNNGPVGTRDISQMTIRELRRRGVRSG